MGGFLLLAENRSVPYPRSPFSFGHLLHLLYEFAGAECRRALAGPEQLDGRGVTRRPWRGDDQLRAGRVAGRSALGVRAARDGAEGEPRTPRVLLAGGERPAQVRRLRASSPGRGLGGAAIP